MKKNIFEKFGSKSQTLQKLAPLLTRSKVPQVYFFSLREWKENKNNILNNICLTFENGTLAVRSSCLSEDSHTSSMAGQFTSVLNVNCTNQQQLKASIVKVIDSYGENQTADDQVLCQRMITEVSMSGVVFTQDMNTGAPYYVINYDDHSGSTESITSGSEYSNKTLLIQRKMVAKPRSERFNLLIHGVREIEEIVGQDTLDIEFAMDKNNNIFILQVRPITTKKNWNRALSRRVNENIDHVFDYLQRIMRNRQEELYGSCTVFGGMPDWNPNEMIGAAPRPLAFSLYRNLITKDVWRRARGKMGYRNPPGKELMISLAGKPFIDVRNSFNSFLPETLSDKVSEKCINTWIDKLKQNTELHDKVEFEVAITGLFFNFGISLEKQMQHALSKSEINEFKSSLFKLTENLIIGSCAPIDYELIKIEKLDRWIEQKKTEKKTRYSVRSLFA